DRDVGTGRPRAAPATAATAAHRGRRGTGVHIGRLPAGARRTAGPSPYHGGPAAPHGVPEVAHRPAAAIRSRATLTIASGVNPNFAASAFSGAEAPNVCIPTTAPSAPVYRSQPSTDACSTATRAVTDGGSTASRYSWGCASNSSQHGM